MLRQKFDNIINRYIPLDSGDEKVQVSFQDDVEKLANTRFSEGRGKTSGALNFTTVQNRRYKLVRWVRALEDFNLEYKYDLEDHKKLLVNNDCIKRNIKGLTIDIETINELKSFKDTPVGDKSFFHKSVVYLQLISGRRIGEINQDFKYDNGNVIFTPLKKKKIASEDDVKEGIAVMFEGGPRFFFKPTTSVEDFKAHHDAIKNELSGYNANTLARKVNRFLEKLKISTHKLRAIYAYFITKNKDGSRANNYGKALNHKGNTSSCFYDYIKINEVPKGSYECNECKRVLKNSSRKNHEKSKTHIKNISN